MSAAPVLVVGAGAVGLTMAISLRRLGVPVRLVDRARERSTLSKALVLWPRTLELLDIQGCTEQLLAHGLPVRTARILAHGRTLVELDLGSAPSPHPFALMIPQDQTERVLDEELQRQGGAIERGVELLDFIDGGAEVTCRLRCPDGAYETVTTPWLIACDGAHSTIRHRLGLAFAGDSMPSGWLLADTRIDGLDPAAIAICLESDGVLALFPMAGDRFRVIANLPADGGDGAPTLAEVTALVHARGFPDARPHDPTWLGRFRIDERKLVDYRQGRVFLAGDAAHVHSPAGGQGMNTGMQDAINLAWKLALVERGLAPDGLLDSYSTERSAVGDQVLRNTGALTRVATVRNPILQQLRDLAASMLGQVDALTERLILQLTELDLHYAHGPLVSASGHGRPANGQRAPDCAVTEPGGIDGRLYALLRDGRFVVLGAGVPNAPDETLAGLARFAVTADPAYRPGYRYLIRPDGYVAASADNEIPPARLLSGLGLFA